MLDLTPALTRITGAGGTPDAVEWTPAPNGGPDLALRGQGSGDETASVTACVRDSG
jgi:hypothetical protein